MPHRRRRRMLALIPVVLFLTWTVFIYRFTPAGIVASIGMENGYVATLLLGFIGGLSVLVSIPYHLVIMTLAAGGLNPWLLGLTCSIGQFAGDNTTFLLGHTGRHLAPGRMSDFIGRFRCWCLRHPSWQAALVLFIYGSLSPISNDWLLIPLGFAGYPYWRVMLPLEAGNLVFNTSMALLGTYGLATFFGA